MAEDDRGGDELAPSGVGQTEDGGFEDGGVRVEDVLDLGGEDLLAAGDDHVLLAIDDVEVALGVEGREVAGAEPAVDEGLGGLVGTLPVAGRDGGAARADLADGAAVGWDGAAVVADDGELDGDTRTAGLGAEAELLFGRQRLQVLLQEAEGQVRARLGHAVGLDVLAAHHAHDLAHDLGRDRRAAGQDAAQARVVARLGARVPHEAVEHRRDQVRERGALDFDGAEDRLLLEARDHHVPPADPRDREGRPSVGEVEHRRDVSPGVGVAEAELGHGRQRMGPDVAVGQHHALGAAGRSRRVVKMSERVGGEVGRAAGLGESRKGLGVGRAGEVGEKRVLGALAQPEQVRRERAQAGEGGDRWCELRGGQQDRGVAVPEDEVELLGREAEVQGDEDGPEPGAGEVGLEVGRGVELEGRHPRS